MTKRSILIIPKIAGSEAIEKVRASFDPLADKIQAHVTLIFPFESAIYADVLLEHVNTVVASMEPFRMTFELPKSDRDGDAWLPVAAGRSDIIEMHDQLYTGILSEFLSKSHSYGPHITLAHVAEDRMKDALLAARNLSGEFEGQVDHVVIEKILDDGRSEIENVVKLAVKSTASD